MESLSLTQPTWAAAGRAVAATLEHAAQSSNDATLLIPSFSGPLNETLTDRKQVLSTLARLLGCILANDRQVKIFLPLAASSVTFPNDLKALAAKYPHEGPRGLAFFAFQFASKGLSCSTVICSHPRKDPGPYMCFVQAPPPQDVAYHIDSPCPAFSSTLGSRAISPSKRFLYDLQRLLSATTPTDGPSTP